MFHFLNKSLNLQLILLFMLTVWAGWTIFAQMTILPANGTLLLFQFIMIIWEWNAVIIRIAVLFLVLTMTIGIIQHFQTHHFSDNRSYMPGVFLLLLLNCGKYLHTLTPALLTLFVMALLMMMYSPNEQAGKMRDRIFAFGLLISFATFQDISAFGLVLFLIMMIALNNVTSFKDNLILVIGLSFPYIWAFAIAFISNGLQAFTQVWRDLTVLAPFKQFTAMRPIEYVTLAVFAIVTILLMIRSKRLLDNKLIVIRQAFNNINMLLISMLLFLWIGIVPLPMALQYLIVPVSIYMSLSVIQKKRCLFVDFLIITLCVLLWL